MSIVNIREGWFNHASLVHRMSAYFLLSWIFALGAQIIIPLPFNLVPLALNPLPLLVAAHLFGIHAVYAYGIYLAQGLMGAPIFMGFKSGIFYLLGPTGGYSLGFLGAMFFLAVTRSLCAQSRLSLGIRLAACAAIYFSFGLAQLAFFVPSVDLLSIGLYPFILGDTCKLIAIMILF